MQKKQPFTVGKTVQDLAIFAIDRTDLKALLATLPDSGNANLTTINGTNSGTISGIFQI